MPVELIITRIMHNDPVVKTFLSSVSSSKDSVMCMNLHFPTTFPLAHGVLITCKSIIH